MLRQRDRGRSAGAARFGPLSHRSLALRRGERDADVVVLHQHPAEEPGPDGARDAGGGEREAEGGILGGTVPVSCVGAEADGEQRERGDVKTRVCQADCLSRRAARDAERPVGESGQGRQQGAADSGDVQRDGEVQPELLAIGRVHGESDERAGVPRDRISDEHRVDRMPRDLDFAVHGMPPECTGSSPRPPRPPSSLRLREMQTGKPLTCTDDADGEFSATFPRCPRPSLASPVPRVGSCHRAGTAAACGCGSIAGRASARRTTVRAATYARSTKKQPMYR